MTSAPTVPAEPQLALASDTGLSSSARVTRLNTASPQTTLDFVVNDTIPGATIRLYATLAGGVQRLIGSTQATGTSTLVTTTGTAALGLCSKCAIRCCASVGFCVEL